MGITNKDLGKAIKSSEGASIRAKMGSEKGNRYIQSIHNSLHSSSNSRKCGYD